MQLVRDLVIGSLGITDLRGLENLASFGNELSIINNDQLVTLRHLGDNLPPEYRTSIRNLGIRDNPLLRDFDGLSYIQNIEGMHHIYAIFSLHSYYTALAWDIIE